MKNDWTLAVDQLPACKECGGRPKLAKVREFGRVIPDVYYAMWLRCDRCGWSGPHARVYDYEIPFHQLITIRGLLKDWTDAHGGTPCAITEPSKSLDPFDQLPVHLL